LSYNLYLACIISNSDEANIIDIFKIETEDFSTFKLRKVCTKKFTQNEYPKFK